MSNKKLQRLTEELYSQPHLISQNSFNAISQYLNHRNTFGADLSSVVNIGVPEEAEAETNAGIGVIDVVGALTYKPVYGMCGMVNGTSYTGVLAQASELIANGAKTLILNCDSGGGQGYGAFETGAELRKMCDEAGVYSIAYNDGTMASACYALAVQCDEVISNPAAETGSIGVLIALMNNSKHLEQEGYTRSFISAGAQKIPFADDGSFKPEFLADLQMKVDAMYEQFVSYVSQHTGLSVEDVKATEAKCFMAQDALALGLINKIQTRAEFTNYVVSNFANK
jgi:ClpP class serine protease